MARALRNPPDRRRPPALPPRAIAAAGASLVVSAREQRRTERYEQKARRRARDTKKARNPHSERITYGETRVNPTRKSSFSSHPPPFVLTFGRSLERFRYRRRA